MGHTAAIWVLVVIGTVPPFLYGQNPAAPSRLLLVAPNLALTARGLSVDRDELVLWVSIHEITHAVQFSAAPWLRDHLGGLLKELIDGLQVTLAGRSSAPGGER